MLVLTQDAAEVIREIVESSPDPGEAGLRISAEPMSETEATLEMTLAEEPEPTDAVVEQEGARVYLEELAAEALSDKVLDASVEDEGIRFTIVEQTSGPIQGRNGPSPDVQ